MTRATDNTDRPATDSLGNIHRVRLWSRRRRARSLEREDRHIPKTEPMLKYCWNAVGRSRHACSIRRRASAQNPHLVVYQGDKGPGAGKHIVLLAGDHEYRCEESLPALARIMAKHYGFKCSVFFTTDPQDRIHRAGQLEHRRARGAEDGRPPGRLPAVPGFPRRRDAAHRRLPGSRRTGRRLSHGDARLSDQAARREVPEISPGTIRRATITGGFGRQILGETWVSHYGTQPQAELAAAAAGRPADASDPARRERRLGAVGRLYGRSDRGQPRPGDGADPRTA